jgi:hypothetical protein
MIGTAITISETSELIFPIRGAYRYSASFAIAPSPSNRKDDYLAQYRERISHSRLAGYPIWSLHTIKGTMISLYLVK